MAKCAKDNSIHEDVTNDSLIFGGDSMSVVGVIVQANNDKFVHARFLLQETHRIRRTQLSAVFKFQLSRSRIAVSQPGKIQHQRRGHWLHGASQLECVDLKSVVSVLFARRRGVFTTPTPSGVM